MNSALNLYETTQLFISHYLGRDKRKVSVEPNQGASLLGGRGGKTYVAVESVLKQVCVWFP